MKATAQLASIFTPLRSGHWVRAKARRAWRRGLAGHCHRGVCKGRGTPPGPPARRRIRGCSAQWSSPLSSNFASREVITARRYSASQNPLIYFLTKGMYEMNWSLPPHFALNPPLCLPPEQWSGRGKERQPEGAAAPAGHDSATPPAELPGVPCAAPAEGRGGRGGEEEERRRLRMSLRPSGVWTHGGCRAPDPGLRRSPHQAPRPLACQGGLAPVVTAAACPAFSAARAGRLCRLLAPPRSPSPSCAPESPPPPPWPRVVKAAALRAPRTAPPRPKVPAPPRPLPLRSPRSWKSPWRPRRRRRSSLCPRIAPSSRWGPPWPRARGGGGGRTSACGRRGRFRKSLGGDRPPRCPRPLSRVSSRIRSHPSSWVCSLGHRRGLWRGPAACLWDARTPLPSAPSSYSRVRGPPASSPSSPPPAASLRLLTKERDHRRAPGGVEAGLRRGFALASSAVLSHELKEKGGGCSLFYLPAG